MDYEDDDVKEKFNCEICGKFFNRWNNLTRHVAKVHEGKKDKIKDESYEPNSKGKFF